jgi:hypothetical protein
VAPSVVSKAVVNRIFFMDNAFFVLMHGLWKAPMKP